MTSTGTLVVAIGQPFAGDDAVGLVIAERLRAEGVPAQSVADGAALVDALTGASRAVIIDAVVGGGPAGTVLYMSADELRARSGATPVSSHGLSVADALALASALGGAAEAHFVGVAIEPAAGASTSLSASVAAAVEPAAARVRELLSPTNAANTGGQADVATANVITELECTSRA